MQYLVCGKITILFLPVLRSIVCSTYLYRKVHISAGQLACHHNCPGIFQGEVLSASATECKLRLSVVRASSRDGQDMITPTVITLSPLLHSLFSRFLFCSLLISILFPSWPYKRIFKQLVSSTSQVIFTDTSVPPLLSSSWRQSLDTHRSFQTERRLWKRHLASIQY